MSPSSNLAQEMVRVTEHLPRTGRGIDNLLSQLKVVLTENPLAQLVQVDATKSHIHLEKLVPVSEATEDQIGPSLHEAIRNAPMEEYTWDGPKSPHEQLFEMFNLIEKEGFFATHFLYGSFDSLRQWIKIPVKAKTVYGVGIHHVKELPEDGIVLCGSDNRNADPKDIKFSVKVVIG